MSKRDVVVLSAARSAVGTFGGALSDIEPTELAGIVMKETIRRSGADPKLINYVTVGNTIPTEGRSAYVARVASIQAGMKVTVVNSSQGWLEIRSRYGRPPGFIRQDTAVMVAQN